jgi:hypothetical protein
MMHGSETWATDAEQFTEQVLERTGKVEYYWCQMVGRRGDEVRGSMLRKADHEDQGKHGYMGIIIIPRRT